MFWLYAAIAAFVVAAGITVVETYNHAVKSSAEAKIVADQAMQRAAQAQRSKANLQELVDAGDQLTKDQQADLAKKDAKLRAMDGQVRALALADPKAYACEDTAVPSALRELRRDAFGAGAPGGVLHPANAAGANPGPAAPGRDLRGPAQGSQRDPKGPGEGEQRQGDRAPAPREAKPAAPGTRERLEALMRR